MEDRMTTPARPSPILDLCRRVTPCLTVHDAAENRRAARERLHGIHVPGCLEGCLANEAGGTVVARLPIGMIRANRGRSRGVSRSLCDPPRPGV